MESALKARVIIDRASGSLNCLKKKLLITARWTLPSANFSLIFFYEGI